MHDQPQKPLPLDYASPRTGQPQRAEDRPKIAPPKDISEFENPVVVLETAVHADLGAAMAQLGRAGIESAIRRGNTPAPYTQRIDAIVVEAEKKSAAERIIAELLSRRKRVAKLPRQSLDGLKTRSEGGWWTDPPEHFTT